jgi:hypothetical protein
LIRKKRTERSVQQQDGKAVEQIAEQNACKDIGTVLQRKHDTADAKTEKGSVNSQDFFSFEILPKKDMTDKPSLKRSDKSK